ncbi:MAG: CRISPR-associated endonuclease Cas2 [Patescibacteria group bacterium]
MGKIEEEYRKRRRNAEIQKVVLGTIAVAGGLSVSLLAPNALQALKMLGFKTTRRIESIKEAKTRLIRAGLISYNGNVLSLTAKGETKLSLLELNEYKIKKPKRWDKKWRVLIFDISESRKTLRDKVRRTLIAVGFIRLQDSVWVYPYDCEDLIALLKTDFKIGKELLYMIVDSIENDEIIKEQFGSIS